MNPINLLALLVLVITAMTGATIITLYFYFKILSKNREFPDYGNRKDLCGIDPALAHGHNEPHI
tara:strand:+ start:351 stop:542 length:192 start_codon:yes stop_codon:yes gene_type:complete